MTPSAANLTDAVSSIREKIKSSNTETPRPRQATDPDSSLTLKDC